MCWDAVGTVVDTSASENEHCQHTLDSSFGYAEPQTCKIAQMPHGKFKCSTLSYSMVLISEIHILDKTFFFKNSMMEFLITAVGNEQSRVRRRKDLDSTLFIPRDDSFRKIRIPLNAAELLRIKKELM